MNIQTLTNRIKDDPILNNIASFFENELYLVGGSVRDILLGKDYTDRDLIVADEDADTFSRRVAEFLDGVWIPLDEENKIYRIVLKDKINYLDITNPVENSLEKDIQRRDLTINAIAVNIRTGEIPQVCVPYVSDVENKNLKAISEQNFVDDPLRILRVFRFYSVLGFEIDEELFSILKKYSEMISKPAKERVEYELMKLFDGEYCYLALQKMDECGLLEFLFPFVKELKQVPPNLHHHLNLFDHSIETVRQIGVLYKASKESVKEHMDSVDFGGFSRLAHLRLAAFMHDIGKFSTWTIEEDTGRHRFIKHEDVGAKMCVPILKNLCFSNKQIEYISYIIKNHMYPSSVVCAPEMNEKVMMRFIRHSEDNVIDNILIAKADRFSARGEAVTDEMVEDNITSLDKLLNYYHEVKDSLAPLPKLLDGNEVMKMLNITPSKRLGEIMNELKEAQISGTVLTKEDAVSFVKNIGKF
ncbi:HD domain-containing protein [bacterium]|nr:HD domain-containing protein [bacterium]